MVSQFTLSNAEGNHTSGEEVPLMCFDNAQDARDLSMTCLRGFILPWKGSPKEVLEVPWPSALAATLSLAHGPERTPLQGSD